MQATEAHFTDMLQHRRGSLALVIDQKSPADALLRTMQSKCVPISMATCQQRRDDCKFHCTIIDPNEMEVSSVAEAIQQSAQGPSFSMPALPAAINNSSPATKARPASSIFNFDILGVGSASGCWFAILSVPQGDCLRHVCKLPPKAFHVTMGFECSDNHSATKDCTVIKTWNDVASLTRASALMNISQYVAPKAARELACIERHLEVSCALDSSDLCAVKLRLSKALINGGQIAEAQAIISNVIDAAANARDANTLLEAIAVQHIMTVGCRLKPPQEAVVDTLDCLNRHKMFLDGQTVEGNEQQRRLIQIACDAVVFASKQEKRRELWYLLPNGHLRLVSLPLNFALQGGHDLAGSGEPSVRSILGVAACGFKTIITLTEQGLPAEVRAAAPQLRYLHFPIHDRKAPPSLQDLIKIAVTVKDDSVPVLVHCLGGKGRTSLVLAAVLMMRQAAHNSLPYSTGEAIALLKEKRSVLMSAEQVHMLGRLYGDLTSQESMDRVDLPASFPCPRIMCVGLPCSGKSHFISMLMRAFGAQRVWRASQDELGRDECQSLWAQYPEPGCVCVLDRCNLTAAERRVWLDLCHKSPTVCMYFNINSTTCIERSVSRDMHPTLPAARAPRIIQSLAAQLEPPTLGEGFCSLHEITCDEDLQLLLRKMGVLETKSQFSDEVVPFPRTTHLINLGAATDDDQVLVKRDGRAADEAVENLFAEAFKIGARIVVEEKVDGANMGIRLMSDGSIGVQNRSHFVTCKSGEQFKRLDWWIEQHTEQLHALLNNPRWVLYGEWMLMKHSVYYDRLPDIFLAFDLYDRASKAFMSREFLQRRLDESAAKCCCSAANAIKQVPLVAAFASPTDLLTAKSVKQLVASNQSQVGTSTAEGVYMKVCNGDIVIDRFKVVREGFIAGTGARHWMHVHDFGVRARNKVLLPLYDDAASE